jgi:hypothetical protein
MGDCDCSWSLWLVGDAYFTETRRMNSITPHLRLVEGSTRLDFEAEVARLLEHPDGKAAWEQLKLLLRRVIPAANTSLACVPPSPVNPDLEAQQTDP